MPTYELTAKQKRQVVKALLECPTMLNNASRDGVVNQLPHHIKTGIDRGSSANLDVLNILDRCLIYDDGLKNLLDAVALLDGDSLPFQNVKHLVGKIPESDQPDRETPTFVFLPDDLRKSRFIGRRAFIAKVKTALIPKNGAAKVAIFGMGGVGKTITAHQIATELVMNYPGGVFWAPLPENNGDSGAILRNWARQCKITLLDENIEPLQEQMQKFFIGRNAPVLIIVDDVREEWVKQTKDVLFKAFSNSISILVTTRDLSLAEELGVEDQYFLLGDMIYQDGYKLLKQGFDGALDKINPKSVENLLVTVGLLPLAIKLARGCLRLALSALDTKSNYYLEALEREIVELHERIEHQTVEKTWQKLNATFKVSLQSIPEAHQILFCQLGIFPPGIISVADIAEIASIDQKIVDVTLRSLYVVSLINRYPITKAITLHPLLRQFALSELGEEKAKVLHVAAYTYFMKQFSFSDDLELLLKAYYHAIQAGREDWGAVILLEYELSDRLIRQGRKDRLIELSRKILGNVPKGISYAQFLQNQGYTALESPDTESSYRAKLYRQLGKCAEALNQNSQALECYQRGEKLLGDSDPRALIRLYREMAVVQFRLGKDHLEDALEHCRDGLNKLAKYSDEDGRWDEADLHMSAGMILGKLKRYDEAFSKYEQAQKKYEAIGALSRAFEAYDNMGVMLQLQEKLTESRVYHEKALKYYQDTKYPLGIAQVSVNLGACLQDLGKLDEARDYYETARQSFENIGDEQGTIYCVNNLGELKLIANDPAGALSLLQEGYQKSKQIALKEGEDVAGSLLYEAYLALGQHEKVQNFASYVDRVKDPDSALSILLKAYKMATQIGNKDGENSAGKLLCEVYVTLKQLKNAQKYAKYADGNRDEQAS